MLTLPQASKQHGQRHLQAPESQTGAKDHSSAVKDDEELFNEENVVGSGGDVKKRHSGIEEGGGKQAGEKEDQEKEDADGKKLYFEDVIACPAFHFHEGFNPGDNW